MQTFNVKIIFFLLILFSAPYCQKWSNGAARLADVPCTQGPGRLQSQQLYLYVKERLFELTSQQTISSFKERLIDLTTAIFFIFN